MDVTATAPTTEPNEWSIDELARRAGLPVRTIREYQTLGVLPAPRRRGRVGIYGTSHLVRLKLIGRLQARGYSLAGIRDLLGAWRDGADLGEVLGLAPDQLVHLDEPGVPATLDQLATVLPSLVPDRLDDLIATGAVEACGPDRYCIPSPSLLQLTVADPTIDLLGAPPPEADRDRLLALAERGRGLLAHGTGRLTVHTIGRRLGATDEDSVATVLSQHLEGHTR